jgi:hypothetical protein
MAISVAETREFVPAVAISALELSRYPGFEKSTTRSVCGATVIANVPLALVVVAAVPTDTFTPESTAPVESVTTPPIVVDELGVVDELLQAANARIAESATAVPAHTLPTPVLRFIYIRLAARSSALSDIGWHKEGARLQHGGRRVGVPRRSYVYAAH